MNQHTPHLDLLAEIRAHCEKEGLALSAFGEAAVGDPRFVADLTKGRECRSRTVSRVRDYISTGITHAQAKAARSAP